MFYHITSGLNKLGDETYDTWGKLGFFRLPPSNPENAGLNVGSIGNPFEVSAKAESIEGACALVKELSDVEYQTFMEVEMGQVIVTDTEYDKSKVMPYVVECLPLFDEVTTYTPWFDRIFGAGEGVELNNAAVAAISGTDPTQAMKDLRQFAIDNATRWVIVRSK